MPTMSTPSPSSTEPSDLAQQRHLQECLRDSLLRPLSWNSWQQAFARLARSTSVSGACSVQDWRLQMTLKFGQGWQQPKPEDMTDLAPVIAAALERHTATRVPAAEPPANSLDSDALVMLVQKHLRKPLPWNAWQVLLGRIRRHLRSCHVDTTYSTYVGIMEETFGLQWKTTLQTRRRVVRKTLRETWKRCISDPLCLRQRRARKHTRCPQRLRKIINELTQNLLELSPGVPLTRAQLQRTRELAHRALRAVGGFPRRMHPNSLANFT